MHSKCSIPKSNKENLAKNYDYANKYKNNRGASDLLQYKIQAIYFL